MKEREGIGLVAGLLLGDMRGGFDKAVRRRASFLEFIVLWS